MRPAVRRRLALLAAPALAAGIAAPAGAQISPPPPQVEMPPQFHRARLGDSEVTTLLDGAMQGTSEGIRKFFPDSRPEEIDPLRDRSFRIQGGLHQPVGADVVNTGRNLAMTDCGGHSSFIPTTGRTLEALRASGHLPEQVDTVILTHIHPEHALGLSFDGTTRNFPNAEVVVTQENHRFWTDPAMEGHVPQGQRFIEAGRRDTRPATSPGGSRARTVPC